MQLTKAGNLRARLRMASPTGLKHKDMCRFLPRRGPEVRVPWRVDPGTVVCCRPNRLVPSEKIWRILWTRMPHTKKKHALDVCKCLSLNAMRQCFNFSHWNTTEKKVGITSDMLSLHCQLTHIFENSLPGLVTMATSHLQKNRWHFLKKVHLTCRPAMQTYKKMSQRPRCEFAKWRSSTSSQVCPEMTWIEKVTPQKTNMTMKKQPWMKMYLLLKMVICFHCHFSFLGCI